MFCLFQSMALFCTPNVPVHGSCVGIRRPGVSEFMDLSSRKRWEGPQQRMGRNVGSISTAAYTRKCPELPEPNSAPDCAYQRRREEGQDQDLEHLWRPSIANWRRTHCPPDSCGGYRTGLRPNREVSRAIVHEGCGRVDGVE